MARRSEDDTCSGRVEANAAQRIRRRLLAWFVRHRRDLPWRRTRDPYAIWLSEMMLQQTQVETVIPYYERFMAAYPSVEALAAASLDDVLRMWAGLGYYARARNLHKAAQIVSREYGGRFPKTGEGLMALPGVGRYSAGAIASIAHDARAPIVDGNVARVLARLFAVGGDVRAGPGRERMWAIAENLLPRRRCGDFNQALMELGATVCLPGEAARCLTCPVRGECVAAARGIAAKLPLPTKRAAVKVETHVVAAIERGGRWLFVRRPEGGLWGGMWALPSAVMEGGNGDRAKQTHVVARGIARELGFADARPEQQAFCEVEHVLTHRRVRFVGHACQMRGEPGVQGAECVRWLTVEEAEAVGLSTAMRKVIERLGNE